MLTLVSGIYEASCVYIINQKGSFYVHDEIESFFERIEIET